MIVIAYLATAAAAAAAAVDRLSHGNLTAVEDGRRKKMNGCAI